MTDALIIGAGPAGLMAADVMSAAGLRVVVADQMPSPARKFLMAGKSGLNLTKQEPMAQFLTAYGDSPVVGYVRRFGPDQVQALARGLGQDLFTGSTKRVFPKGMKASPMLRMWLARLAGQGVTLHTRWRWTGWDGAACVFDTPHGSKRITPTVTVLALGGGSWARLGSDGAWARHLPGAVAPFQGSNVGLRVAWSAHMARHFGGPVKSVALRAGQSVSRGELVISAQGIEGGGIYPLAPALRDGAALTLDLLPDRGLHDITTRLARPRGKATLANHLRKTLGLDPVKIALLQEWARPLPGDSAALAAVVKSLPVRHDGPFPLDQAISTAGGVMWGALTPDLMLHTRPGTFCAGEMLDWDAPTGGYLLTACFATGLAAGQGAVRYAQAMARR